MQALLQKFLLYSQLAAGAADQCVPGAYLFVTSLTRSVSLHISTPSGMLAARTAGQCVPGASPIARLSGFRNEHQHPILTVEY